AERYRFERMNSFACLIHRLDLVLETLRRGRGAKLTGGVYLHCSAHNCSAIDPGDEGFCLGFWCADADRVGLARNTLIADIDVVIACGEICTSYKAHADVAAAGCVYECTVADGGVEVAGCVGIKRFATFGCQLRNKSPPLLTPQSAHGQGQIANPS